MKILLIGGTGLAGSHLLPLLVQAGHHVYAITRQDRKLEQLREAGARGFRGNIRDPGTFLKDLPGKPDLIILLAMPGIRPGQRITPRRKSELREETNDFFRNSMELAMRFGIPLILPGGTSYRTGEDETADEAWPVYRAGLTAIGSDTDGMVNRAIETGNPQIMQLIYGRIYGNGGLFRFMYETMEKGRFKIIGDGDNYIPNIHAADAASAIMRAIEKMPLGEKFIVSDDTAATQKEFVLCMADMMKKKPPGHLPGFLGKWILGKDVYEVLRMNCRVSNAKAKKMLGWRPVYPSYREGLEETIKVIKETFNP